ncbi:calcium uptake protein 2, mitochondrial isoform 2-T2 [Menidia menidia]
MASWGKFAAVLRNVLRSSRSVKSFAVRRAVGPGILGSIIGTGAILYYQYHAGSKTLPFAVHAEEEKEAAAPVLSARRIRFIQFASVVYEEEPYMTPRDFLFSVMLEKVDRKLQKRILTAQEVDGMLTAAHKARPGAELFRNLGDNGLISYTEYLFLLTILTKPRTGFHIAFKMLDVDGNEHVDNKEFLKLKKIISKSKRRQPKDASEAPAEEEACVNTTLQAYFFGRKGDDKLQYKEFHRFMEDLQAEVQEMEFLQFSKGMDTMRREDFAEWLLHYTNEEDNEVYWENMRKKIPAGQSITFDEFKAFCLFTNNLEDFAFSMKMVTEANRPVGMAQFRRAVKIATGHELSESVLDTVFKLFDMDGDNCLSHKEFMGVMTDRVLRGLKVQPHRSIGGYWKCVKRETLKGAQEALGQNGCPI